MSDTKDGAATRMVGKMSLQEKIADLERRIVALERPRSTSTQLQDGAFGYKWRGLWRAFDDYFDSVFGRKI